MRLSEWIEQATIPESVSEPVLAVVESLLADLGVEAGADCWVVWGEDPSMRYSVLAPSLAGLASVTVRATGSADGPRGNGKLVRWSKLSVSELTVESAGGHRIVAVQVENYVLKGVDEQADRICEFVRLLLAGMENRSEPVVPVVTLAGPGVARSAVAAVVPPEPTAKSKRAAKGTGTAVRPADGAGTPNAPDSRKATRAAEAPTVHRAPTTSADAAVATNAEADLADAPGSMPGTQSEEPEGPAETDTRSREEVAAIRRATAAAMLLSDMGRVGPDGPRSPSDAALPTDAHVAAGPTPAIESARPIANPEPAPSPPAPAPVLPPVPPVPLPPIPGRDAWVQPHPIVDAEPIPKKPKRWAP